MAEYIDRESLIKRFCEKCNEEMSESPCEPSDCFAREVIKTIPAADVAPVRHGRWIEHEETPDDAYLHHKCSECNVNAPFDYKMREDWDEGMDGEWDSLGLVDDGINEHLTDYCPNCGAKMMGG